MNAAIPENIHPSLRQLVKKLAEAGAARVILFGSRARGDNAPRADIDLAVELNKKVDRSVWAAMLDAIENADTLLKIDAVLLDEVGSDLRQNIEKDGKILYDEHQSR